MFAEDAALLGRLVASRTAHEGRLGSAQPQAGVLVDHLRHRPVLKADQLKPRHTLEGPMSNAWPFCSGRGKTRDGRKQRDKANYNYFHKNIIEEVETGASDCSLKPLNL